jgi:hypothetical protein
MTCGPKLVPNALLQTVEGQQATSPPNAMTELRGGEFEPHTASVKTPVLQRATASTVYRIMPACNLSST